MNTRKNKSSLRQRIPDYSFIICSSPYYDAWLSSLHSCSVSQFLFYHRYQTWVSARLTDLLRSLHVPRAAPRLMMSLYLRRGCPTLLEPTSLPGSFIPFTPLGWSHLILRIDLRYRCWMVLRSLMWWRYRVQVSLPYIISGMMHWLYTESVLLSPHLACSPWWHSYR